MQAAVIGLVLGMLALQQQARLPGYIGLALASLLLLAVAVLRRAGGTAVGAGSGWMALGRAGMRLVWGTALGFYWAAWCASGSLAESLPPELEGKNLQLVGVVSDLPNRFEGGTRFAFRVESAHLAKQPVVVPTNLIIGWYEGQTVLAGERWRLTVRLQRPHGNANPHGFDYELWLLEQGVRATGYARDGDAPGDNQRLASLVWGPTTALARLRENLRQRIYEAVPDARYAGVLVGLVLGDQRAISQADWTLFNQTGVSHLMSISGLHITMVAGLFGALLGFLWRRSFYTRANLPLLLPAQKVAALAAASMALLYVALTGFGIPAQRTLIMLAVVALARCLDRINAVAPVLCSALWLVLLFDPWAVMWPGFWLSFGAVGLILYASAGRIDVGLPGMVWLAATPEGGDDQPQGRWRSWLGIRQTVGAKSIPLAAVFRRVQPLRARWWRELSSAIRTQYIVTLGLLPLSLLLFGQYSLVGPLANALAIPVVSFIVTPLALLGSIAPGPLCACLLASSHWVLAKLVQALAAMSQSGVWNAPQPPLDLFLLAMAGILWLLAPRGWPLRSLGLILCLPLLFNQTAHPETGQLWVTVFDVGQGTSVLLETAHHRLLYDTGPQYSMTSDGGNRVILPYLKNRGIQRLDGMVVSHRDLDHVGGALSIMQALPINWVASSLEASHPVVQQARGHRPCFAGQYWQWDGVRFEILHPAPGSYADHTLKSNARSCTLKVSTAKASMLLPGDIEAPQERALLADHARDLPVTILLAPHHGSGTSSTLAFLQALHPAYALFQLGHHNRYHHPKAEVYARYGQLGIARLRTDELGAISIQMDQGVQISAYRQTHPRYWYDQ